MGDQLDLKFINCLGSVILLIYVILLRHNNTLFVLEEYETNRMVYASIYASIIVSLPFQQKNGVFLPLNYYYLTIVASILMFGVRHLSAHGFSRLIWIPLYSLAITFLWWSVVFDVKKNKNTRKRVKKSKLFQNKYNKTFNTVKKLNKVKQKQNKSIFTSLCELYRIVIRNCIICNVLWHTINLAMLINKYILNQSINNDNLLDIMWIYWTAEYINYQTEILKVEHNIIAPYILIIFLFISSSYHMFFLIRLICIIISLLMIIYKLSDDGNMKQLHNDNKNKKPNYLTQNGELLNNAAVDDELTQLVESLPLDYFFSSLYISSFGVIMAPSIISVFWRVWHFIPLVLNKNWHGGDVVYQKAVIMFIQFTQSIFVMYVVVKEYRLYVLWKYHKIFDIYTTLFTFALHTIISKLPFVIFSVCFFQYFVYGSDSCMNGEDELNPEMGTIKPPTAILFLFYMSFVVNCWVVYYKCFWKNGDILYKTIRLSEPTGVQYSSIRSSFHFMDLFDESHFNVLFFHEFDSLKIHVAGLWVHFCGRVFSIFRKDTTIEMIHIGTSMILIISAAYHHISHQNKFHNKESQKVGYFGFCFVFACLATLMFKLYVVATVCESIFGCYGIIRDSIHDSWKHIRNIHIA